MKSLIVMPTYNERENIREIVPEILKFNVTSCDDVIFHILIVDDNSPDGTAKVVEELSVKHPEVNILHRKEKSGLGSAYIEGFKWGLKKDYDLFFEMDADFSHNPKYLPDFLEKIKEYDLLIGSRYYQGRISVVNWDFKRVVLSNLANKYARMVTGVPVNDATAGFKCFKRKVLESIDLDKIYSQAYSFQVEMNWRCHKAGFKIGEIPIIFYERRHGESKLSASIIGEGLWILWKMRLKR